MHYSLVCECGKSIAVSASAAGSQLVCRCGRSVDVPPLSKLRVMAGRDPYEASTIDIIRRMIRSGELPHGRRCALSGRLADDTIVFRVQCERVWTRGSGADRCDNAFMDLLIHLLLLDHAAAVLRRVYGSRPRREFGRETYVDVPLRVCSDLRRQLKRKSQETLKTILRQVPIYDALLSEFPEALVFPKDSR
jgi:hypothetical protein